ncbi:putative endosomal membrane protein EMP70 [Penaeus vannamei]|uniref:Transmembrane 9 superfamily member n=1 Tax=Penaeus vannamei TaxID=6689 RepID=A0A423SKL2_PENVA|nr:putative endosomal membrane protein EMP70 [Penaeus vannamei]
MILMRTLRKDYARYSKDEEMDDMERDLGDEYGWKQVHGDVFRPPSHPMLFSALVGSGYQMLTVTFLVILLAIVGELYTERGSMVSIAIFIYAATSPVNGYFGGSLYARMGGKVWIRQMMMSAFMLPSLVCGTAFFINFIAIYYHASRAIAFTIMLAVICICTFVILPLTLVGTVLGRNLAGQPNYPCRINAVPRPIPEKKWFMEPLVIIPLGGILPFGSIFIEMYFIFTSFWAYKIYYVYGFMLLVFLILLVVVVCVTIVCAYFLLNAEDYRWQWTSFLAAASTAGYVYLYATYYFFFKTKMYGFFQTSFYFGYMALFSVTLGIMCGTIGYVGTSKIPATAASDIELKEDSSPSSPRHKRILWWDNITKRRYCVNSPRRRPASRGTSDMIFAVRQLQEKCREQNQELHLVFVDLTKAFDTVNRNGLWKILQKFGCPDKLTALIASFHDSMQVRVQENGDSSDPFQEKNGVKQGCVLAPTLFSFLFAAMLLADLRECNRGVYIPFRIDGKFFNLQRLKAKTRVSEAILQDFLFTDDCTGCTLP